MEEKPTAMQNILGDKLTTVAGIVLTGLIFARENLPEEVDGPWWSYGIGIAVALLTATTRR